MNLRIALVSAVVALPVAAFALNTGAPDAPLEAVASSAKTFEIDASHSAALFRVKHLGVSYYYGRFNEFGGAVVLDEEDPTQSSVEVEIQAESVDTNSEGRDDHLRGPDFFNAKEYPTITFKSSSIAKKEGSTYEVTGNLEMRGVTKEVVAEVEHIGTADTGRGVRAGFEATMTIKRTDFGMDYGVGQALGDEVRLIFGFECIAK